MFDRNDIEIDIDEQIPASLCKCIAEGNLVEAERITKNNSSSIAVQKIERVQCPSSGDIYLNVSAIELAYLLDEMDIHKILVENIDDIDDKKIADAQLKNKRSQVNRQLANFKKYDYTEIVSAISSDETLKKTGIANSNTCDIHTRFKQYFEPCEISIGKSLTMLHLQRAYLVGDEQNQWNDKQKKWYKTFIIGTLQARVHKSHQFVFSQGLQSFLLQKTPVSRKDEVKDITNPKNKANPPLINYHGTADKKLGEHFFIDICYGTATTQESEWGESLRNPRLTEYLELVNNYFKQSVNNSNKEKNVLRRLS